MRRLQAVLMTMALVLTLALPAHATVWKFGDKSCSTWYQVSIHSLSSGTTNNFVYSPFQTTGSWNNGSSMKVRNSYTQRQAAEWGVSTTGALNDTNTYGWCAPDFE